MIDPMDERLKEAKERLRRKQKLRTMLAEAERLLHQEEGKRDSHRWRLDEERADVEKLEGLNLTALFYTVLGSKEEQLEKERQELLSARLKYEESAEAVEESRRHLEELRNELSELADAENEHERILREKARQITEAGDQRAELLLGLSERLADAEADQKELEEALQAGESALESLNAVRSELGSAANWGTFDMIGGGLLSTHIKHSKIDEAKKEAAFAQRKLRRFQEELAHAGDRLRVSLDIGGLASFADYFFDGLISDWVVQSKIGEASRACSTATSRVRAALEECRRRLEEVEGEISRVREERREFLEEA